MTLYDEYIEGVTSGKIDVPKYVLLAVERHLSDLEKDWEWTFDRERADKVIKFMGRLRLPGGSLQFQKWSDHMKPFQGWYFAMVYGWVHKETGFRRFREVYWNTPRKSAKSAKTAGEAIYHLIADGAGAPVIQCVATKRDQAKYVYDAAFAMASKFRKESKKANKILNLKQYTIENTQNFGYIECLTADAIKNDGGNAQLGSIDEYHAHSDSSMYDVVSSSQGERDQPLIKITTTAGFNKNGPDYKKRKIVKQILEGVIENDRLFGAIWEPDEGDKIDDPKVWEKVSPLWPVSPKPDYMESEFNKASTEGGEAMVNFKTKLLNMYVDSATVWIKTKLYSRCADYKTIEDLRGLSCVLGVDLASEEDTTALSYLFPPQPGLDKAYYFTVYYCPEHKFGVSRVDGVLYSEFLPNGWMIKTSGDVIDSERIVNDIIENAEIFDLKLVGYDPYKSIDIITKLQEVGIECMKIRQSASILGMGNSLWKKMVLKEEIAHDGNPVTSWQMGNIEMYTDGNGNQKIVKGQGKKKNKVDGPVSLSNAFVSYIELMQDFKPKELGVADLGEL